MKGMERQKGESWGAYKARRRAVNAAIELHGRGKLAFVSTEVLRLPLLGVDAKVDEQILQGKIRQVTLVTLKNGTQFRVGRTKGVTYRKPVAV